MEIPPVVDWLFYMLKQNWLQSALMRTMRLCKTDEHCTPCVEAQERRRTAPSGSDSHWHCLRYIGLDTLAYISIRSFQIWHPLEMIEPTRSYQYLKSSLQILFQGQYLENFYNSYDQTMLDSLDEQVSEWMGKEARDGTQNFGRENDSLRLW